MKKILIVLFVVFFFTGCSLLEDNSKPEEAVDMFFEKYRTLDDDIITQLKDVIDGEDLEDSSKEKYQELMEKQYDQFAYVIKDIKQDDTSAVATIELTVLNYRSAVLEAEQELKNNPENFNDEQGNFSEKKYMEYKIDKMDKVTDTTTHTIELTMIKENGMWKIDQMTSDDISKLHGLY